SCPNRQDACSTIKNKIPLLWNGHLARTGKMPVPQSKIKFLSCGTGILPEQARCLFHNQK
ncbi:hypothetical protein QUB35_36235, partial [Microcoleus sp. B13-B6]